MCNSARQWFNASLVVPAVAAVLVLFGNRCQGQGTMTFTFEAEPPGSTTPVSVYNESGMQFSNPYGAQNLVLAGNGVSGLPSDGTAFLQVSTGADLGFTFLSGAHFNLVSFDAAGYGTSYGGASLEVIGYKAMGVMVTNFFAVDSVNNRRTGLLPDFQTFTFDSQFQNVFRVDVLTDRWSLDNLVVSGVPEPSSTALIVMGGACVAIYRRARQRSQRYGAVKEPPA